MLSVLLGGPAAAQSENPGKYPFAADSAAVVGEYLAVQASAESEDDTPYTGGGLGAGGVLAFIDAKYVAAATVDAALPSAALAYGGGRRRDGGALGDQWPTGNLERGLATAYDGAGRVRVGTYALDIGRLSTFSNRYGGASIRVQYDRWHMPEITYVDPRGQSQTWHPNLNDPHQIQAQLESLRHQTERISRVDWQSPISAWERQYPLVNRMEFWDQSLYAVGGGAGVVGKWIPPAGWVGGAISAYHTGINDAHWRQVGLAGRGSTTSTGLQEVSIFSNMAAGQLNQSKPFIDAGLSRSWVGSAGAVLSGVGAVWGGADSHAKHNLLRQEISSNIAFLRTQQGRQAVDLAARGAVVDVFRDLQIVSCIRSGKDLATVAPTLGRLNETAVFPRVTDPLVSHVSGGTLGKFHGLASPGRLGVVGVGNAGLQQFYGVPIGSAGTFSPTSYLNQATTRSEYISRSLNVIEHGYRPVDRNWTQWQRMPTVTNPVVSPAHTSHHMPSANLDRRW